MIIDLSLCTVDAFATPLHPVFASISAAAPLVSGSSLTVDALAYHALRSALAAPAHAEIRWGRVRLVPASSPDPSTIL